MCQQIDLKQVVQLTQTLQPARGPAATRFESNTDTESHVLEPPHLLPDALSGASVGVSTDC